MSERLIAARAALLNTVKRYAPVNVTFSAEAERRLGAAMSELETAAAQASTEAVAALENTLSQERARISSLEGEVTRLTNARNPFEVTAPPPEAVPFEAPEQPAPAPVEPSPPVVTPKAKKRAAHD